MDDRKPPDTNVVRLRRNGDPSDEERQRLASKIFAEQDEVSTFSRGNLVPPAPPAPPASNDPPAADPFFEQLETISLDEIISRLDNGRAKLDISGRAIRVGAVDRAAFSSAESLLPSVLALATSYAALGNFAVPYLDIDE